VHFSQAHGTPFTINPISEALTLSGVSPYGAAILSGDFPHSDMPENVAAILSELKQVRKTLPSTMSFNDMIQGFTKWRESTTTSPSGKQLGIYKAMIHYHNYATLQAKKPTSDKQLSAIATTALHIQHNLINLVIQHTHTFQRWQQVRNFFIEKTQGKPYIHKLRVIHIYEADLESDS
jgi:hypothetical protein